MSHQVIDNLLTNDEINAIQSNLFSLNFPWYYSSIISNPENNNDKNIYYFIHTFYKNFNENSEWFKLITPIINFLKPKALIRIKANFYPIATDNIPHGFHKDQPYLHKGAVFYVNTNNGYTELENGTKIKSIENRILLFDSSKPHQSTSCTDQNNRVTINFNYF